MRPDTIPSAQGAADWLVAERVEPAEFAAPSTGTDGEIFYGRRTARSLRGVMRRTSDAVPVDPKTGQIQWDAWPWARASAVQVPCP